MHEQFYNEIKAYKPRILRSYITELTYAYKCPKKGEPNMPEQEILSFLLISSVGTVKNLVIDLTIA